jgi:ferrous iron transport protein A
MQKERPLHSLLPGEKAVISAVRSSHPELKQRLLTMGLVQGTEVEFKTAAPLGDPISIMVRGYCLSLRKSEAEAVEVVCQ